MAWLPAPQAGHAHGTAAKAPPAGKNRGWPAAQALPDEVIATVQTASGSEPIPRWFVATPSRAVTGHVEAMALYAGQGSARSPRVVPAAQVVTDLAEGAERLLRRWGAGPSAR